jgi:hypothetical protein
MKILAALALVLAVSSCTAMAEGYANSSNREVKVEKLTEVEGCVVYRFDDGGFTHYFTRCPTAPTVTDSTQSCGKNCHRIESIEAQ